MAELLNRYRVLHALTDDREYGPCVVYDKELDRKLVLKFFDPAILEDTRVWKPERYIGFLMEFESLKHPNLSRLVAMKRHGLICYTLSEYEACASLAQLCQNLTFTGAELEELANGLLAGLAYMHSHGLVHGELNPTEVLVRPSDDGLVVKILEPGPMRNQEIVESDMRSDKRFKIRTFGAPEKLRGEQMRAESDLYSLGCVLYYAATGFAPFEPLSELALMLKKGSDSMELATRYELPLKRARPDLPDWICAWIEQLLEEEINKRPRSADEALKLLMLERSMGQLESLSTSIVKVPEEILAPRPVTQEDIDLALDTKKKPHLTEKIALHLSEQGQLDTLKPGVHTSPYFTTSPAQSADELRAKMGKSTPVEPAALPVDIENLSKTGLVRVLGIPKLNSEKLGLEVPFPPVSKQRDTGFTPWQEATPEQAKPRDWYYSIGHKVHGPIHEEQLIQLVKRGAMATTDLVWTEGYLNWRPICETRIVAKINQFEAKKVDGELQKREGGNWLWNKIQLIGFEMLIAFVFVMFMTLVIYPGRMKETHALLDTGVGLAIIGWICIKIRASFHGFFWLIMSFCLPVIGDLFFAFKRPKDAVRSFALLILGLMCLAMMLPRDDFELAVTKAHAEPIFSAIRSEDVLQKAQGVDDLRR